MSLDLVAAVMCITLGALLACDGITAWLGTPLVMLGNRREQVRLAGNAVTPPSSRDLIAVGVEALGGAA